MKSPLLKSALWIVAEIAHYITINPPQPKISKEDIVPKNGNAMNGIVKYLVPTLKFLSISTTIAEIMTVHSSKFRSLTSYPRHCEPAAIDAPFLTSLSLLLIFFTLRVYCYRTLGTLFTFVTSIRPNHKLITGGPYRFVRHPSYTAIYGFWICQILLHISACDSWVVKSVYWVSVMECLMVSLLLGLRTTEEDAVLQKRFGLEWELYSLQVPYRFIPWII